MLGNGRGAKEKTIVKCALQIWEQLQSSCPSVYWAWIVVVQGNSDGGGNVFPSSPCMFI